MVSSIIPFLAFASLTLAHPQRHRQWHHWQAGSPTDFAVPTAGASLPSNGTVQTNGTNFGGSPVDPPAVPTAVKTLTVSPVPLESSPAGSNNFSSAVVPNNVAADAEATDVAGKGTGLDQLAPSSSANIEASSVTAAAFYDRPTYGGGGWGGAPSSAAPVVAPTTFATAVNSVPAGSAPTVPVSSSSPSTGGGSSSGGSSGGKKGLSYNTASLTNAFAGKGISWVYNWAATPDGSFVAGAEFVPMLWGQNSISAWSGAVQSAIASGSKNVLSFNEPDLAEQANIDPATAAKLHIANVAPLSGQVSIGSPSVTNGPAPMGISWLQSFFDSCGGQCNVDFVTFHWYDSAGNAAYFKKHVQDVIDLAAKNGVSKVWLTEFGASGSDSEVAGFLQDVIPWLDSQPAVERYAYFMCSEGILVRGNSISSPIGSAYAS